MKLPMFAVRLAVIGKRCEQPKPTETNMNSERSAKVEQQSLQHANS